MLKRIFIIGLFTGAGQLYSIFVLKLISNIDSPGLSNEIAQLDSLFFFILNLIAFGLQSAAIRDIALAKEWKQEYRRIQSARITLGILLTLGIIAGAFNKYYLIFLIAPVLAYSGEYALYARGAPIFGSIISFLRLSIPFTGVLIAVSFFPSYTGLVYALSLFLVYLFTNFLIGRYLDVPVFFKPALKGLKLYVNSLPLGLVTISQYTMGLGLILIAPYFFEGESLGVVFAGLKFYVLYKGVLRILHQAFVQDMTNPSVSLKVDQLSIMFSFLFLLSVLFFPDSFIRFFFGQQALSQKMFFQLLGIAAFFYSLFLSMTTSALLLRMDRRYALVTVIGSVTAIASAILLSFSFPSATSIGISLCAGEFIWLCGLVGIASKENRIEKRLLFVGEISFFVTIPFLLRYWLGDQLLSYILSLTLVGLLLLFLHHRKFKI